MLGLISSPLLTAQAGLSSPLHTALTDYLHPAHCLGLIVLPSAHCSGKIFFLLSAQARLLSPLLTDQA